MDLQFFKIMELLLLPSLVAVLGFLSAVFFEAFRRRCIHFQNEYRPIFEDPNSLKQVPCSSIFDPTEKYISLVIPAFNEEYRLPGALDETMNYLQQRAEKDRYFTYEVAVLGFLSAVFFEAFRRRCNHFQNEYRPIFEDPNSLKQVPCPSIFDPAEKYISLVIPAFNEEYRLPGALDETMNYLQQRAEKDRYFTYEVLIVDDGSNDGTKRVAFDFVRKYSIENVRVILLGRNHGKGEGIRQGMLHSRGELLLMLDADGATKVNDLEKLECQIRTVAEKELKLKDAVISDSNSRISDIPVSAFGSRAHLEQKALATRKWYRNFLMKGFHLVVLLAAGPGIRDTQCGFKMFTRAAARKLFSNIRLRRWCFDVELVYLCKCFSIPMIEVSVNWSEIPGSKVSLRSIPHMLWELALMFVGYRTHMWRLHT